MRQTPVFFCSFFRRFPQSTNRKNNIFGLYNFISSLFYHAITKMTILFYKKCRKNLWKDMEYERIVLISFKKIPAIGSKNSHFCYEKFNFHSKNKEAPVFYGQFLGQNLYE